MYQGPIILFNFFCRYLRVVQSPALCIQLKSLKANRMQVSGSDSQGYNEAHSGNSISCP